MQPLHGLLNRKDKTMALNKFIFLQHRTLVGG